MIGPHRLRERMRAGKPAIGLMANFASPWIVDATAIAGFDFILIDAEHGPFSPESAEPMIRAAEAGGISPIVRVPGNVPHEILRYLDIGAVGVQVPHLDSVADVEAAAAAVRYPPVGQRGLAPIIRAAGYGLQMPVARYVETANREVVFLAMVESVAAVDAIDAIASTPGVDVIAVGPGDLAMSMGLGGDRNAPAVQKAVDHVIARSRAHGRVVSLPAGDPAAAKQCIERGAGIIQVASVHLLVDAGRKFLAAAM
jgi:4-hydroxy-2-oxoheptanedioate aldolase